MEFKLIAVPSESPGGLASSRSAHFGHCELFTLVPVGDGKPGETSLLANPPHAAGGCLAPIGRLQDQQVEAVVVGGLGRRPLQALEEAGIQILFAPLADYPTVGAAVEGVLRADLLPMAPQQACTGHNCHH